MTADIFAVRLAKFARRCFEDVWEGGDIDGATLQDRGVEYGLLVRVAFNPDFHSDPNGDAQAGDEWYVYAPELQVLLKEKVP